MDMPTVGAVLCLTGAMVGAGFASGREVMAFFSRYGGFSWALCALVGAETGLLTERILRRDREQTGLAVTWLLMLLYLFLAGGMTAASGALWALTVPLHAARTLGGGATLLLCVTVSRYPLKIMGKLGWGLGILLLTAVILCYLIPSQAAETEQARQTDFIPAVLRALGYGCMNVTLSRGILNDLREHGTKKQKKRIALASGLTAGGLLMMENGVLLRHLPDLQDAAMPMVMLLRGFGKAGYILSAALLYISVVTTLIAVCGGVRALLPRDTEKGMILFGLSVCCVALLGFEGIVDRWYPILGWLCFAAYLI